MRWCAGCCPKCDPVHKISIISRGMALGYTMSLPENDRVLVSRTKFEQDLSAMLGGRVAEQLTFNDVTNGAVDDLDKVTKLARAMVTQYGMSESDGADGVRPAPRNDLPGPRDRRAAQLLGAGGAGDRQGSQPDRHRGVRPGDGHPDPATAICSTPIAQEADRGRDAGRRGVRGVLRRRARRSAAQAGAGRESRRRVAQPRQCRRRPAGRAERRRPGLRRRDAGRPSSLEDRNQG